MAQNEDNIPEVVKALEVRTRRLSHDALERIATISVAAIETRCAPYVPVDTSNLINSAFRRVFRAASRWVGIMGYRTPYARSVHDGGPKNWRKAGASDRFLEKGSKDFLAKDWRGVVEGVLK